MTAASIDGMKRSGAGIRSGPSFCAPAKGWEKGSVEAGVKYVRNLMFRPRLAVESWAALNATLLQELEADLPMRHLDDGRTVEQALAQEREHLRALPAHLPDTCRVVARVADKFGHVRVDHVTYSVPIRHAYRPVWVKLYHDRVALAVGAEVLAEHPREFVRGAKVLDAFHVLPLLERKHRAVAEATAPRRLAAGPGVAAGAGRAGEAHAQARSGMGLCGRTSSRQERFGRASEQVAGLCPACACRSGACWPRWNQRIRASFRYEGLVPRPFLQARRIAV